MRPGDKRLFQLVESVRRVKYPAVLLSRGVSQTVTDPTQDAFDPLKAAIVHKRAGSMEEAFWMVFLFVHFGKHPVGGYRYAREIYGRLGKGGLWDWEAVKSGPIEFRNWLDAHQAELRRNPRPGGFGPHRQYESLHARSENGTGAVVASYVHWINSFGSHAAMVEQAKASAQSDRHETFDYLYQSMGVVRRFGRLAKFDYLAMLGKLRLAPIEPGSTYLQDATGPKCGARLLFGGSKSADLSPIDMDTWLRQLDSEIEVGMQALEDALCNWQKSPEQFKPFRS